MCECLWMNSSLQKGSCNPWVHRVTVKYHYCPVTEALLIELWIIYSGLLPSVHYWWPGHNSSTKVTPLSNFLLILPARKSSQEVSCAPEFLTVAHNGGLIR